MVLTPVPVVPSPKFQLTTYGAVPPVTVAVNVTALPDMDVDVDEKNSVMAGAVVSLVLSDAKPQTASNVFEYDQWL